MPTQLTQPSFAAGELSPSLYSRTDLAKYHIGVRTMLNWYVHPQGGTSNCPGTAWVGEVNNSATPGRLIGFQFSTVQTYVLEFGHRTMRVIKDGGYVLEDAHTITSISTANPGVVTYTGSDPSNGDRVWISGVSGMTQVNSRYFHVANVNAGANTFELQDTNGNNVDTSTYNGYSSGGTWARVYTLVTPYVGGNVARLKYEQSADTLTITHKNYAPRKLTRTDHDDWTLSVIVFAPVQQPPTDLTIASPGTAAHYVVTAINDESGEESLRSRDRGASNESAALTWTALDGCTTYSVYKGLNGAYGFIGTAQVPSGSTTVSFTDDDITPDTSTTPPQQRNPFASGSISSVTVNSGGSGYSAPVLTVSDPSGYGSSAELTANLVGDAIGSVTVVKGGKGLIDPKITITDGSGSGAAVQLAFALDGGSKVVGMDGDGNPVTSPTYVITGAAVLAGGSGYASGTRIHTLYSGYEVGGPTVDWGGTVLTAVLTGDVVTGVTLIDAGTERFVDWPGYGFPTSFVDDSAGTGASLTANLTADGTVNPGVTTYHDGRQWYASTAAQPQTMWGSVAGNFNNMSQSTPTRDSDAITRTLASRQVDDIRHMISLSNGMIVLTGGAEWKVSAGQADVITPAQFVARPQSYNGSSDIRPIVANDTLLYVPPNRKKVRTLQYQWAQDSWSGTDMTLLSAHLLKYNIITDWAYARDPDSICWTVRDDGVALAFTFQMEQQLYAWSRRTTTNGAFESVCAIQEGDETAVYFIVRRTIDGVTKRYIERMHSRVFDTIAEAWFLDSALQYSGTAATTISGLWHLVGEEVWALADGIVRGPLTVSDIGQVTLPVAASLVTVGKIIPPADLETLDIDGQDNAGKWTGRKKKVNHVTIALENSANTGMVAGPSGGQGSPVLYAMKGKDLVNPLAAPPSTAPALTTDYMHQIAAPSWDWAGRVLVRVENSPLPYTVTGITVDVTPGS